MNRGEGKSPMERKREGGGAAEESKKRELQGGEKEETARGRKRQIEGEIDMFVFTVFSLGSWYGCFVFPALSLMPRHCCLVLSACLSLLCP